MPRAAVSGRPVIFALFQYPLCRIDSCHSQNKAISTSRMWSFSIRSAGSIHATMTGTEKEYPEFDFQYPLCRIDSCHVLLVPEKSRLYAFSIRSAGSIHATWCLPCRTRTSTLSVSALPDRFMPLRRQAPHLARRRLSVSALPDRFMPPGTTCRPCL